MSSCAPIDEKTLRERLHGLDVNPLETVLVGVSGGLDSTVLLRLLHAAGQPVEAAHVNYGLRDEEADEDARFVAEVCAELGVVLHLRTLVPEDTAGTSRQDQARNVRYRFFEDLATEKGITSVAVAHHRDDQAETVLLQLFRGAGIEGLQGMSPVRPLSSGSSIRLVRPLLEVPRDALASVAKERGWTWRRDRSNDEAKYRRNALRLEILPALEKLFGPQVQTHIAHAAHLLQDYDEAFVTPGLDALWQRIQVATDRGGQLLLSELARLPNALRWAMLLRAAKEWGSEPSRSWQLAHELDALRSQQVGRRHVRDGYTVWRERTYLTFVREAAPLLQQPAVLKSGHPISLRNRTLVWEPLERRPAVLDQGQDVAIIDVEAIDGTLTVRKWQAGDRLQPFGSSHSKLVSDILTDAKVPPSERDDVPVVCDAQGIIWIAGYRLDDRVKVRATTDSYAKITFNRAKPES